MLSLPIYDINKKKIGTIEVNASIFAAEVKPHHINDAVRSHIAHRYEFKTANSRTRTEVHGTRKKMFKQKGTGQARHGDAKSPTFVGGGKAHGPRPRRVQFKLNKKVMRSAMRSALSQHQKLDRLFVVDQLSMEKVSAKAIVQTLKNFGVEKALFVNSCEADGEKAFNRSVRNIKDVKQLKPESVNVFDLLKYTNLLISKKAVEKLTERLKNV